MQGQNDLITGLANLATARSQLTMAQTTEKCTHELYLAQGGALKDWQQAQTDLIAGQNTVRGDEIALHAVRSRLRILCETDEEIASLEAQPTRKLNPEAVVRAPIGSVITQRQIGLVQYINSEANGATNPVYTIAASIDPNTRRLSVPADVENPDGALRPGMFATFSIITGSSETVPAVPQSAIVFEGETARVWVAGDDRTIAARSVGSDGVPTAWSRF